MPEPRGAVEDIASHPVGAKDSVYPWREHKGLSAYMVGRLWKSRLSEVDKRIEAGGAGDEPDEAPAPRQGGRDGRG